MKLLDVNGQPLAPGQFVVYAVTAGHSAPTLKYGIVLKLNQQSVQVQPISGNWRTDDPADPNFRFAGPSNIGGGGNNRGDEKQIWNVLILPGRESLPSRLDVYFEYGYVQA